MLLAAVGASLVAASWLLLRRSVMRMVVLYIATVMVGTLWHSVYLERNGYLTFTDTPTEAGTMNNRLTVRAVVAEEPRTTPRGLTVECHAVAGAKPVVGHTLRCVVADYKFRPKVGQTLLLDGRFRPVYSMRRYGNADGHNGFDFYHWALSRDIVGHLYVRGSDARYDRQPALEALPFWKRMEIKAKIVRGRLLEAFGRESKEIGMADNHRAIVTAMAFGDRSGVDSETRDMFAVTGTAHMLALSGMHLGILYALLGFVVSRLMLHLFRYHVRLFVSQLIVVLTIWGYVMLVGMPLSVVRAAIMLTILSVSPIAGRFYMSFNSLCLAALVMLACNPLSLWDVGFQMSFMAMVGIFLFYSPLLHMLAGWKWVGHGFVKSVLALVALSTAAQLATMPISVYYFGRIPILFLLANIVATPLVTVLLYAVVVVLVVWPVTLLRLLRLKMVAIAAACMWKALEWLSALPWVSVDNVSISSFEVLLMYALIGMLALAYVFAWHAHVLAKARKV